MLEREELFISEENRKNLSDFLIGQRKIKKFSLIKLSQESGISLNELYQIENNTRKKINPFYLQNIALALKIDYKFLYKLVGYLKEDDFNYSESEESFKIPTKEKMMFSMIQNYYGNISLEEAKKIFEILELPQRKRKKIYEYFSFITK